MFSKKILGTNNSALFFNNNTCYNFEIKLKVWQQSQWYVLRPSDKIIPAYEQAQHNKWARVL